MPAIPGHPLTHGSPTFITHPCMEMECLHMADLITVWNCNDGAGAPCQCRDSEHFFWIFQSLARKEHKYRCWNSEKRVCSFSPSRWRLSLHSLLFQVVSPNFSLLVFPSLGLSFSNVLCFLHRHRGRVILGLQGEG